MSDKLKTTDFIDEQSVCQATEDQQQAKRDQVHLFKAAVFYPEQQRLNRAGCHCHGGRHIDVIHLVGDEEQQNGKEVVEKLHVICLNQP